MIIEEVDIDRILEIHSNIPEFIETKADKDYFDNRYKGKDKILLCAQENNVDIGYIIAYDKCKDGSLYCWMAGVIPGYRNQGALTNLMEYLIKWAKSRKYNKIKIKTRNDKRDMLKFLVKDNFNFTNVEEREQIKDNKISLEKLI